VCCVDHHKLFLIVCNLCGEHAVLGLIPEVFRLKSTKVVCHACRARGYLWVLSLDKQLRPTRSSQLWGLSLCLVQHWLQSHLLVHVPWQLPRHLLRYPPKPPQPPNHHAPRQLLRQLLKQPPRQLTGQLQLPRNLPGCSPARPLPGPRPAPKGPAQEQCGPESL